MKSITVFCLLFATAAAHATGLSYTSANSSISASGAIDGFPDMTQCYSDVISPGANSLDGFSGVATGEASSCSSDFGSSADGTLSAITADGFSMSGTVSSYFNSGINEPDSFGNAFVRRDVFFTLTETTELFVDLVYSACNDCLPPGNGSEAYLSFNLIEQGVATIDSENFINPESAGGFSNSYILGPGDYRFQAVIGSGVAFPAGASSEITGQISMSVVPIPAAAWLFFSALAGLGWVRRKHTA